MNILMMLTLLGLILGAAAMAVGLFVQDMSIGFIGVAVTGICLSIICYVCDRTTYLDEDDDDDKGEQDR